MKFYLKIPESLQESINDQSIELHNFINEQIDNTPIEQIFDEENPFGGEGEKGLLSVLAIVSGTVISVGAVIKALKNIDEGVTYFYKKYIVKYVKDKNGYEKIIKEALSDDYKEKEGDNIYIEIIKKEIE